MMGACCSVSRRCAVVRTEIGGADCAFSVCDHNGREVAFVALSEFLPRVRLIAKGVPDDVALEYLGQAAVDFAVKSRLLKRRLVADIQASVQDYYLEAGEAEQIHLVQLVSVGCDCGGGFSRTSCAVRGGYCDSQNGVFDFLPPDKVWLKQPPEADVEEGLLVEYVAAPTQSACEVDRLLFDRYQDGIVSGALGYLLLMNQYGFADPHLADVYERRFKKAVNQAKIDVAREFKTASRHLMGWRCV